MFEVVSIADVAEVFNGKTPPKKEHRETGYPVLKIKDVSASGNFVGEFSTRVDTVFVRAYSNKCLKEKDILILNAAHNASHVASKLYLSEASVSGALATGEWTIIRSDESRILPDYLYHFLSSSEGAARLRFLVKGIHLYPRDVATIELRVPPLDEQRRIVDILGHASSIRRLRAHAQAKAREIIPALFLDMFGDPATNPKGWTEVPFADLVSQFRYGTNQKCHDALADGDATVLRIPNVLNREITWTNLKYTKLGEKELEKLTLQPGDILFVRTNGNPDLIGRCALFGGEEVAAFASYLIRARLRNDAPVIPAYVRDAFSMATYRPNFLRIARTTAGNYNVSVEGLSTLVVPVPPRHLQCEYDERVEELTSFESLARRASSIAEGISQSLLNQAFNGAVS